MKTHTTFLKKSLLAIGLTLGIQSAMAATFTAVSSGNWTSETTWGGEAPGDLITSDDIIIPEGITVYLDTDVTVDGLFSSIDVDGVLEASGDDQLIISSGNLEGEGNIMLSYLAIESFGSMSFSGMAEIDEMVNSSASLVLSSTLNIADTLTLEDGNILLGAGANLGMHSESIVKVNEGTVTIGAGLFSAENPYVLIYVGTEKTTGIEATGSGLTDLYVQLDDNDESIMLTGDVIVNGNIYQESGKIDLNGGNLTLNGDYNSNAGAEFIGNENSDLIINSDGAVSSSIIFNNENETIDNLMIYSESSSNVTFESDINVIGDLTLEESTFKLNGFNTLTVNDGTDITLKNGSIILDEDAAFNGEASYNVMYMGEANLARAELSGSGLNDVTIDLDNNEESIKLSGDSQINGTLSLTAGDIQLNGFDLNLMGDFEANSESEIEGNSASELLISSSESLSDTIFFDSEASSLEKLIVNIEGSGEVVIGSDLFLENLELEEGMIVLIDGNLELAGSGAITGTDKENYISTQGEGSLFLTVDIDSPYMLYPVGNEDGYSPAMIQIENGTSGSFGVNVKGEVLTSGTIGEDVTFTESVVDRTWHISEGTGASTDINLMVAWSSSMELNGFNNEEAYISHYTEGNWDISTAVAATYNEEMDMYEMERQEITSLSPFAVKDSESSLSIDSNEDLALITVYPNPATDIVYLDLMSRNGRIDFVVMNNQGEAVTQLRTVQGGSTITLDFNDLPTGVYFIQVIDGEAVSTEKVIKS